MLIRIIDYNQLSILNYLYRKFLFIAVIIRGVFYLEISGSSTMISKY